MFLFGCNIPKPPLTAVKCQIDSVYKKQIVSVDEQITPTWVYRTNCGNYFSLYKPTYNLGDSLVFLIQTNK